MKVRVSMKVLKMKLKFFIDKFKHRQQILLGKCHTLHDLTHMITDYYGCDECCKLRSLFDDYICPFTKLYKYPEYDEVHKVMQGDVQKEKIHLRYTLK